jgi:nucleoside recognition membrane protein YjiH
MKRGLFLSMSTFVFATVNANIYYFSSNTGYNSRPAEEAQNSSTSWKTISKLNIFFSSLLPGDAVMYSTLTKIFSQAVIKHINDVEEAFENMAKWLKPKGLMSYCIDLTPVESSENSQRHT